MKGRSRTDEQEETFHRLEPMVLGEILSEAQSQYILDHCGRHSAESCVPDACPLFPESDAGADRREGGAPKACAGAGGLYDSVPGGQGDFPGGGGLQWLDAELGKAESGVPDLSEEPAGGLCLYRVRGGQE